MSVKRVRVAITILEKRDFKTKTLIRDKEGNCVIIQGTTQQENKTTVKIFAANTEIPKYIKQLITNIKIATNIDNSNIIIVEDLNTTLTPMDRSSKQKINK